MSPIVFALAAFHAILLVAFAAAFMIPLASAGTEERAERGRSLRSRHVFFDVFGPLLDLVLPLVDSIPVFWLLRVIADTPDDVRAARQRWREEPTVRLCFWVALALSVTLPVYTIFR